MSKVTAALMKDYLSLVEYHKYFERKWHADKEAAEKGESPKKYRAV